jgi:hypothetical protein
VAIRKAVGRLVDELPEERFTPGLVDSYWAKGAAIMVCQDHETSDWLAVSVPNMTAWEGSKLKVVGLEALTTFKRVAAWIPGPVVDTDTFLRRLCRLNRGLETADWRVYERREESNGLRLVLSIDQDSVATPERLQWKPSSGVARAVFSLLGAKSQEKRDKPTEAVMVEDARPSRLTELGSRPVAPSEAPEHKVYPGLEPSTGPCLEAPGRELSSS